MKIEILSNQARPPISFPGWGNFGALLAHMRFLKEHLRRIDKVAVVADGAVAGIMPKIANHFVHAQVRHFDFASEGAAWVWLMQGGSDRGGTAKKRSATHDQRNNP
ncbi:MAG: STAS/SEC14 domain-containing protein [Gallionella sp.]